MTRAKASGYALKSSDAPIILGMVARDDRDHDIAAWFGVNQGRIADVKEGKFGTPAAAPASTLPPKGPPGMKGRRLYQTVRTTLESLKKNPSGSQEAIDRLSAAIKAYEANEA
jgi:hypothetical protein